MDARVRRWMAASGAPIGHTTPAQRDAMPEDDLHRRNVEIAARQQQLDEVMLDDDADFDAIDDEMDDLLAESDEIEALLEDRFRVVGGGRLWLQPAIAEASAIARQLAPPPPDALAGSRASVATTWAARLEEALAARSAPAVYASGVLKGAHDEFERREREGEERARKRPRKAKAQARAPPAASYTWRVGAIWVRLPDRVTPGPVRVDFGSAVVVLEQDGDTRSLNAPDADRGWGVHTPFGAIHVLCRERVARVDTEVFASSDNDDASSSSLLRVQLAFHPRVFTQRSSRPVLRLAIHNALAACDAIDPFDVHDRVADDDDDHIAMTIAGLYGALQPSSSAPVYPSALLPSTVTAIPSRYQLQAVAWMVDREGRAVDVDDPCCARFNVASPDGLHDSVWFDRVTGRFAVDPPARVRAPCGGILADEMGLGKSLETLLLISARRRDPGECGRVLLSPWDGRPVTTCATTLIVAPRSLLAQWRCELERHCPHLSSLTYLSSSSSVTAKDMSSVDVVLTSFDVLRQEVHYSKAVPYGLRGEKVHRIPTTPLLELQFHRLVCDEAQQVDNTVTGAAQMALRIEARARWCVTGTPLGRHGLDDFRALFTMIAYDPFQAGGAFSTLLLAPWYAGDPRPMLAAVGAVFWRNSKASVARELHLPPLTTTDVRLSFNTVEAECYRRLRAETRTLVMDDDRRGALPYGNKDEDVFLHRRLEQLRQACCHPQVQNGHSGFDTCRGHRMMSMDQISETLCRAAQDDVSGAERDLCRALNRLGALHIAAGDDRRAWSALAQAWRIAESGYEHATSSSEFALVPTESIVTANSQHRAWQQVLIVTLTLLDGVATRLLASDEAAADDPDLVSSADLVARQRKTTLDEHLVVLLERVRDIRDLIGDYVGSVLDLHMPACGADARRLAERIRREAPALSPDLLDAAVTLQGRLAAERNAIDVRLRAQRLHDVNELIGLCEGPAGRLKQRCLAELCGPSVVGTSSRLSFRSLLVRERASLLKSLGDNADPVATRDDCLALTAQRVQVDSGLLITKIAREVEKQRGRLDEAERALDDERRCIAGWCAIPDTSAEADRSRLLAQVSNLRVTCQRALSHVRYLRYRFSAGGHETTCAICLAVADQPVITVCFHLFCRNCIVNILDRKGNGKCPSCRHALSTTTMYTVVSHADDRQSGAAAAPSPSEAAMLSQEMVGAQQFSTKIGAVVRSILWACRQSPGAKVLVFSQFRPILSIVSRALAANGVEHRHLDGNLRERASALELFQDPGSRVRALLMSLRHDASGLTLHAAQYVVLVEPSLNPAIEDQAISRVHRRGQTRSTFVYRFLVDRSIEEKIIEIQRHRRELMRRQQDEGDGAPDSVPARVAMREHVSMPELLRCLDDDT